MTATEVQRIKDTLLRFSVYGTPLHKAITDAADALEEYRKLLVPKE